LDVWFGLVYTHVYLVVGLDFTLLVVVGYQFATLKTYTFSPLAGLPTLPTHTPRCGWFGFEAWLPVPQRFAGSHPFTHTVPTLHIYVCYTRLVHVLGYVHILGYTHGYGYVWFTFGLVYGWFPGLVRWSSLHHTLPHYALPQFWFPTPLPHIYPFAHTGFTPHTHTL